MSTFVSLVGMQPTAVAVALASLYASENECLSQIIFLPTEKTWPLTQRLMSWAKSQYDLPCQCIKISNNTEPQGDLLPPHQIFSEIIAKRKNADAIFFNADPGFNFHVSSIGMHLPSEAISLHPRADRVHAMRLVNENEHWSEFPLVDLGLENLLKLHDVSYSFTGTATGAIEDLLQHENIEPTKKGVQLLGGKACFDLAFEKGGQFFCLKWFDKADNNKKRREQLAAFRDLQRARNDLRGLLPKIAILSPDSRIQDRARRARFLSIHISSNHGKALWRQWVKRIVPTPAKQEPLKSKSTYNVTRHSGSGAGGDGAPLAVCLGNDPSATLLSLFTHRPRHVWLCFDQQTPAVVEMALRLKQLALSLPVGQIDWVPTDVLGKAISGQVGDSLAKVAGCIKVDVTPGSKAQGLALGRLAAVHSQVEVWTLRGREGKATPLIAEHPLSLTLQAPNIVTQAEICGGELMNAAQAVDALRMKTIPFFMALARYMARLYENNPASETRNPGYHLEPGVCRGGKLESLGNDHWRVIIDGKEHRGVCSPEGGFFFESLTAAAFHFAGVDEIVCGLKWDWPFGLQAREGDGRLITMHMEEVDVIARFGHRFLAISCKTGQDELEKARREIEAMAFNSMGRFCVPFLARPYVPDDIVQKSLDTPRKAAIIDVRYLADPNKLLQAVKRKIETMSG